tara:strand:- start:1 stop:372 length:372 start_codon:yes stop_codon:yes gene_type:complete
VQVPHVDGRVGMAALLPEENGRDGGDGGGDGRSPREVDMATLFAEAEAQLPPFAVPRFVRLLRGSDDVDTTLTFKPRVATLQAGGFDPSVVPRVYVRDAAARTYVPLDAATHADIVAGRRALG